MTTLQIQTAPVFKPLLKPSRYKAAHGGRGSGKSFLFAEMVVEDSLLEPGLLTVCIREVQKTLADSSKRLIEKKIIDLGVGREFNVLRDRIETPGNGLVIFQGMQDHTAESIKSLAGFKRAWVDEAQTLSARSLSMLRPTLRETGSEIWFSWNPTRKADAVDHFFRGNGDRIANPWSPWPDPATVPVHERAIVVQANWRDNPWWNETLEAERKLELERYPDRYGHTYEGEYAKAFEGAYFAKHLAQTRLKGRICSLEVDKVLPIFAFFDIGGAGAQADANSIWVVQFVGPQIRVLDYIEGRGQEISYYQQEMRSRGWGRAIIRTPHDGANVNAVGKRYVDYWREAGFETTDPVPNQGAGAAMLRIEALRRIFPNIWFNNTPAIEGGLDAIGFYHERKDETRNIGLGPDHDWSSHAADALGLMAIIYEAPDGPEPPRERYRSSRRSSGGSWESA